MILDREWRRIITYYWIKITWWSVAYNLDGVLIVGELGGEDMIDPLASMGEKNFLVNTFISVHSHLLSDSKGK